MTAFSVPEHALSPRQVKGMLDRGEIELIDVREPYEWEAGRIPGARHIELERLAARTASLPRGRTLVFQCRIGARSALATQAFRASGWTAYNLEGGITAWVESGLPIEPEEGFVAEH